MSNESEDQRVARLERENQALRAVLGVKAECDHQWSLTTYSNGDKWGRGLEEECLKCLKRRAYE